ncbi:MAG: NAD(P)/FAD-dependent oxidoreductase [Phycisphaerae bacterium]|nr:NAD(P)/FAD-dependent oxidoreductase [Phycisphaerae bacterium]
MPFDIAIIGGGAAGLMAAVHAGQTGASVCVIERNSALGRKLLKTGGGRCNLTHQAPVDELVRTYTDCGKFLRHALYTFSPDTVVQFFAERRLACKIEKDGCVFPITDRATDVCRILRDDARRAGVQYIYGRRVEAVEKSADTFTLRTPDQTISARTILIATGGVSWPHTGSDGDGYRFAKSFGHTIVPPRASVCPVVASEPWINDLQGVAIEQVVLQAKGNRKKCAGAMIFTENGLGGPAAFDLSRQITDTLFESRGPVPVTVDFLPDTPPDALDALLIEQCAAHAKREMAAILTGLLPRALAIKLTEMTEPSHTVLAGQLKKEHRRKLADLIKKLPLTLTATAPLAQATVTRGGVALNEINPKTMQSRLCPGLFFAGETLNADGPCGGYNLQIAWSTGMLAAQSAAKTASAL